MPLHSGLKKEQQKISFLTAVSCANTKRKSIGFFRLTEMMAEPMLRNWKRPIADVLRPQGSAISFSTPNNQLGLAYVKENEQFPEPMETAIVLRRGAGHNDSDAFGQEFASGTAIREWSLHHGKETEREDLGRFVPQETLEALERRPLLDWASYWAMLQYQLMLLSHTELRNIYQVEEGLEYRLKKEAEDAADFMAFIRRMKNKRWTWARLQRVCSYILLGITKDEADSFQKKADTIRLLGFTEGRKTLSEQLEKKHGYSDRHEIA